MSTEDALIRLGKSSSEAISGVLEMFAAGKVTAGEVSVIAADKNPMESVPLPAVATNVAYVDGVTGGNVFVMTLDGARNLAAAVSIPLIADADRLRQRARRAAHRAGLRGGRGGGPPHRGPGGAQAVRTPERPPDRSAGRVRRQDPGGGRCPP